MDVNAIYRVCRGDYVERMCLLPGFTGHPGDVSIPWLTETFDAIWRDAKTGCWGFFGATTES